MTTVNGRQWTDADRAALSESMKTLAANLERKRLARSNDAAIAASAAAARKAVRGR